MIGQAHEGTPISDHGSLPKPHPLCLDWREWQGSALPAQSGRAFLLSHRHDAGRGAEDGGAEAGKIPPRVGPKAPPLAPRFPPDWTDWERSSQSQQAAEGRWDAAYGEEKDPTSPGISPSRARPAGLLGTSWAGSLKGWGWPEPGRGAPEQPTPGRKGTLGNGLQEVGEKATFSSLCSHSQFRAVAHQSGGLGSLPLFSKGSVDPRQQRDGVAGSH